VPVAAAQRTGGPSSENRGTATVSLTPFCADIRFEEQLLSCFQQNLPRNQIVHVEIHTQLEYIHFCDVLVAIFHTLNYLMAIYYREHRNMSGGKAWPACKADNLTSIYEQTV
jgi:thiol-disulfide isomerase/thioredoxin